MIVIPTPGLLRILDELIAAGNELDGLLLGLFVNDVNPGPSTVLADLEEATVAVFPGYARQGPLVWGNPFIGTDGTAMTLATSVQFDCTAPASCNVYGYMAIAPAVVGPPAVAAHLVFAERFPESIPIIGADTSLPLWPRFTFGQ